MRIRFSKLTSKSTGITKTRTAVKWARMFVDELYESLWFYFFGINLSNIDYELFGPSSDGQDRDFRIYNRFFEIGLFPATGNRGDAITICASTSFSFHTVHPL